MIEWELLKPVLQKLKGKRMKWVLGVFGVVAGLAAIALGVFVSLAYLALPGLEGTRTLPGLDASAEIQRDEIGLVTIRAANDHDAYFALGFAHAQDRLWQMEMTRRIGAGRLSELLGSGVLGIDRYVRTMGFYRLAEAQLDHLSTETLAALNAYSKGVNAWLENRDRPLPLQFQLLFHDPEPWVPADSLVWARLMAFQLSTNMGSERTRERLSRTLSPEQLQAILPGSEPDEPTTIPSTAKALLDRYIPPPPELESHTASNAWVLAGDKTATGSPILANDPHLGFTAPNLWYFANIETPDLKLSGVTVPGVPFHILGHNDQIAWGFTTTYADTQDLFVETVSEDGDAYKTAAGWQDFETREETIDVRLDDPLTLRARYSKHGPVISDLWGESDVAAGTAIALSFTGLSEADRTPEALFLLNRAKNRTDFESAMRLYSAPVQNIHYADRAGTIGLIAPGKIPVRANGDGLAPVDASSGSYAWIGTIPFTGLPQLFNPPGGIIRNANNRLVDSTFPNLISSEWPPALRAHRLDELIASAQHPHRVEDSISWQMDIVSDAARRLLPFMIRVDTYEDRSAKAVNLLKSWDGSMAQHRPEPLIYATWLNLLTVAIAGDEAGTAFPRHWQERELFLQSVLDGSQAEWCDNIQTPNVETCGAILAETLEDTLRELRSKYGGEPEDWAWGSAHQAVFESRFLGRIPGLSALANLSIPTSGGDHTLNRGQSAPGEEIPFRHVHGAGYRAVYDLSDLSNSRFTLAGGQSGNFLSPHYDDLLEDWRDGRYFRSSGRLHGIDGEQKRILVLQPN